MTVQHTIDNIKENATGLLVILWMFLSLNPNTLQNKLSKFETKILSSE